MKRAILYARVSSEEQAQGGYSIQTQLEKCREYATRKGYCVVGEYTDAVSGALLSRPRLDVARRELEQHRADAIIVYTSDRLSRNLAHSLILREEFAKWAIELHFVDRGQYEDSAEARLMQNVEGVIAEYEREKIKERTRRGRLAKVQSGKWHGQTVPFGYQRVGKRTEANLIIDEHAEHIIRRIFEEFLAGKTIFSIARCLNMERIPTPRSGRGWSRFMVWKVLSKARIYCRGELHYHSIVISLPKLAFLPEHWAVGVENQLQRNKEHSKRNAKRMFILSHRVFCHCGRRCHANHRAYADKSAYDSYRCGALIGGERRTGHESHNSISANKLNEAVWNELMKYLDPVTLREGLQELRARKDREQDSERARLATIDTLVEKGDALIETIMREFGQSDDETVRASARKQIQTTVENKKSLLREREELVRKMAQGIPSPEQEDALVKIAYQLRGKLERATDEQKREAVEILQVEVSLDPAEKKDDDKPSGGRVKQAWLSFVLTTEQVPIELPRLPTRRPAGA